MKRIPLMSAALLVMALLIIASTLPPAKQAHATTTDGDCGRVVFEGWSGGTGILRNYVGVFSFWGDMLFVQYTRKFYNDSANWSRENTRNNGLAPPRDHLEEDHFTEAPYGFTTAHLRGWAILARAELACIFRGTSFEIMLARGRESEWAYRNDGSGLNYSRDKTAWWWEKQNIAGTPPTRSEFLNMMAVSKGEPTPVKPRKHLTTRSKLKHLKHSAR